MIRHGMAMVICEWPANRLAQYEKAQKVSAGRYLLAIPEYDGPSGVTAY